MAKITIEPHGKKGHCIRVENPDAKLGAILYIERNGYVHCDSHLGEMK